MGEEAGAGQGPEEGTRGTKDGRTRETTDGAETTGGRTDECRAGRETAKVREVGVSPLEYKRKVTKTPLE